MELRCSTRLDRIFTPVLSKKIVDMDGRADLLFAHYTSAEAAMKILDGENIWLRNSRCMNDTQEIEAGLARLQEDVFEEPGKRFQEFLDSEFDGFWEKSNEQITKLFEKFRDETYFLSVSEHQEDEGGLGRLSMWRAYGGSAPVALVLKKDVFLRKVDDTALSVIPVEYHIKSKSKSEPGYLSSLIWRMTTYRVELEGLDPEIILKNLVNLAIQIAFGTKHSGFKEEREWRVAYNPAHRPSSEIRMTRQTIAQVPQKIGVIDFAKIPNDRGGKGVGISDFLERIIIGPMEHPNVVKNAFVDYLLGGKQDPTPEELKKATSMVIVSDIPLRC